MQVVHSFWFKPFFHDTGSRVFGGFKETRFFWYSWVLSFLNVYLKYQNVSLVSDDFGCEQVKRLKLPYHKVSNHLENLPISRKQFWNLGKFHAYLLQSEPFLHLDTDVFIWRPLPDKLLSAPLFGQSWECNRGQRDYYEPQLLVMKQYLSNLSVELRAMDATTKDFKAMNCGIFGGQSLDLIHKYSQSCLDFLTCSENEAGWAEIEARTDSDVSLSNCSVAIEQLNILAVAQQASVEPLVLIPDGGPSDSEAQRGLGYSHMVADAKSNAYNLHLLEQRMQKDCSEYKRIIDTELNELK